MKPGTRGWIGLIALVIAADLLDERSMSEVFRELSRHPAGRWVVIPGYLYLTAHLFGLLPPGYDLLHLALSHAKGRHAKQ